jgi:hypothetical protein
MIDYEYILRGFRDEFNLWNYRFFNLILFFYVQKIVKI